MVSPISTYVVNKITRSPPMSSSKGWCTCFRAKSYAVNQITWSPLMSSSKGLAHNVSERRNNDETGGSDAFVRLGQGEELQSEGRLGKVVNMHWSKFMKLRDDHHSSSFTVIIIIHHDNHHSSSFTMIIIIHHHSQ